MNWFDIISSIILLGAIYIALSLWWAERNQTFVPPAPTLPWVRKRALELLQNHLPPDQPHKIADLGCGVGGALFALGKVYKTSELTGYELSNWPYRIAKLRAFFKGKRYAIKKESFFDSDLSGYDAVFCYLTPKLMTDLAPKLETLKSGSLILSCAFPLLDREPLEQVEIKAPIKTTLYLYKVS